MANLGDGKAVDWHAVRSHIYTVTYGARMKTDADLALGYSTLDPSHVRDGPVSAGTFGAQSQHGRLINVRRFPERAG